MIATQLQRTRDKQPLMLGFTPTGSLESSINLACVFLECGSELLFPEKVHASTGRMYTQEDSNPEPLNFKGGVSAPPCPSC